jgi:hypothetical protein
MQPNYTLIALLLLAWAASAQVSVQDRKGLGAPLPPTVVGPAGSVSPGSLLKNMRNRLVARAAQKGPLIQNDLPSHDCQGVVLKLAFQQPARTL